MGIKKRITDIKRKISYGFEKEGRKSYSQFGEDIIIDIVFYLLQKQSVSYLDIGANFPKHFSNTYYFYEKGHKGVCIEPDAELYAYYKKIRPRDAVFNIGVGINEADETKEFFFYKGSRKGLNTFSEARLEHNEMAGNEKPQKTLVTLRNINKIIEENFTAAPDFISIDIEGMDREVLGSLDFSKYVPPVICCEITKIESNGIIVQNTELTDFLLSRGYFQYANTFINGIFVHNRYEAQVRKVQNWY